MEAAAFMQPKVFNKNFCSPPYLGGRQNTETGGGFRVEAPQKRVDITVFGFEKAHGSTFIVGRRLFAGDKGGDIGSEFIRLKSGEDRKSTRLNSSHVRISYAVFCLKKKI